MLRKAVALISLIFIVGAVPLMADIIYLKNGNRIEVDGAEVKGDSVVFSVFNGRMTIDIGLVARIEKTNSPAPADAGITNGISGTPFAGTASPMMASEDPNQNADQQADEERKQLVQFYIGQRQNLLKELKVTEEQIQTLRSVIYAKANIFADTTEDRARVTEFEQRKAQAEEKLQTIIQDARKAGLTPAELRQVESARAESADANRVDARSKVTIVGAPAYSRDSRAKTYEPDSNDDKRSSKTVLGEDKTTEPPPPEN